MVLARSKNTILSLYALSSSLFPYEHPPPYNINVLARVQSSSSTHFFIAAETSVPFTANSSAESPVKAPPFRCFAVGVVFGFLPASIAAFRAYSSAKSPAAPVSLNTSLARSCAKSNSGAASTAASASLTALTQSPFFIQHTARPLNATATTHRYAETAHSPLSCVASAPSPRVNPHARATNPECSTDPCIHASPHRLKHESYDSIAALKSSPALSASSAMDNSSHADKSEIDAARLLPPDDDVFDDVDANDDSRTHAPTLTTVIFCPSFVVFTRHRSKLRSSVDADMD
jgi:hypothetical protein